MNQTRRFFQCVVEDGHDTVFIPQSLPDPKFKLDLDSIKCELSDTTHNLLAFFDHEHKRWRVISMKEILDWVYKSENLEDRIEQIEKKVGQFILSHQKNTDNSRLEETITDTQSNLCKALERITFLEHKLKSSPTQPIEIPAKATRKPKA